jgi:hypothetical protein
MDVGVGIDVLDVVVVFQGLDQLHQGGDRVAGERGHDLGPPGKRGGLGRAERGFQRLRHVRQGVEGGVDGVAVLVGFHVVGAGLDGGSITLSSLRPWP